MKDNGSIYKAGIRIYYCGWEACEPGHFFGPATRAHYLMHFVLSGKGVYQVEGKAYELETGGVFLIKPYELTYYKADDKMPWEYVWVAFDGAEAERLLHQYQLSGSGYVCRFQDMEKTREYLFKLCNDYNKQGHNQEALIGWFYLIFSTMLRDVFYETGNEAGYYQEAEKYIRHNYGYDINVNEIAGHIGIDRTYLYKIFKKYTGKSPKQYLTFCRLKAAKDMLDNTLLSITEIALSCGFHDSSVFCKNFLKDTKMNPQKYRQRNRTG